MSAEKPFDENWVMPDGYVFVTRAEMLEADEADDDGIDDDDVAAVFADIRARRGVAE